MQEEPMDLALRLFLVLGREIKHKGMDEQEIKQDYWKARKEEGGWGKGSHKATKIEKNSLAVKVTATGEKNLISPVCR